MKSTPISYAFIGFCLLISVPSAFSESYFELFSGELPHEYWWQSFTMVFQHGAVSQPLSILIHLGLNMFLMVVCGVEVEKMLGLKKFLILTCSAWAGFIVTQLVSAHWINGSSGVIWAYSPFLILHITRAKLDSSYQMVAERSRGILLIMWVVVTVIMGFVPLIFNPNHSLLYTFFFGNLFHASGVLVGFIFYLVWKKELLNF